jgi:predicted nuclease with TOPRIM domain
MRTTTWKRNTTGLTDYANRRKQETHQRVDQAIARLVRENKLINFNAVAHAAGVTKSYLYAQADLRERIEALRTPHNNMKKLPSATLSRSDASKEMLLAAKDRRIKALEAENLRLKEELKRALGRAYDQL